jgi:response regulator RpfG family c-di-GMP phosphodiesterase
MNVLIADDEPEIAEIIEFLVADKFPEKGEIFVVHSGNKAIEILKNHKIDLCISDHNMPDGNGAAVLRHIINSKLQIKFVLCTTVTAKEMPVEYPAEHIFFNVVKPKIVDGMKSLAEFIKLNSTPTAVVENNEIDYIPVSLDFLLNLEKTPSELYIQISEKKFIKCVNESDPFTDADKEKYLKKSISKLYIKKSDDKLLMNKLITDAIAKIMHNKEMPLDEKMAITHSQLCDMIQFAGMTEELASITKANIHQTVQLIMKNNLLADFWKDINFLGEYPSQLYSLHSMLASFIARKLEWSSEATLFKLTLAAFLQDITLKSIGLMQIYDHQHFLKVEESFKSHEVKNFLEHPLKAKDYINSFKEIPPDVDKIILEQHEMPDGTGFPRKLNANQLGPLSCLFILSGLLARSILHEKENFKIENFVKKFEELGYSKGNFKDSFNILKKM